MVFLQNRLLNLQPRPAGVSYSLWYQHLTATPPDDYIWNQDQGYIQEQRLSGANGKFVYANKTESDTQLQGNSNERQGDFDEHNEEEFIKRAEASDEISARNTLPSNKRNINRDWSKALHVERCKTATHNVYYVKVHKTGSSTFVTLLYDFARRHNLMLYPIINDIDERGHNIINQRFVPPKEHKDVVFNIFGEHAWFNETIATWAMPRNTTYIASIRYPYSQIRSYFNEFKLGKKMGFNSSDPVEEFLRASYKHGTFKCCICWRHGIERLSALLALSEGNPLMNPHLPHKMPVMQNVGLFSLLITRASCWINSRIAGYLRHLRHRGAQVSAI